MLVNLLFFFSCQAILKINDYVMLFYHTEGWPTNLQSLYSEY